MESIQELLNRSWDRVEIREENYSYVDDSTRKKVGGLEFRVFVGAPLERVRDWQHLPSGLRIEEIKNNMQDFSSCILTVVVYPTNEQTERYLRLRNDVLNGVREKLNITSPA